MTREESNLLFNHLYRKKYIETMERTEYGWKGEPWLSCPSDLEFISEEEEPFKGECHMSCEECWKHVLHNKKW